MKTKFYFIKIISFFILAGFLFVACEKTSDISDSNDDDNTNPPVTPKIIDIKSNGDKAVYLTNTGFVYTATLISSSGVNTIAKAKVAGLQDIIKIGVGPFYAVAGLQPYLALDKNGQIFTWNCNFITGQPDSAIVFSKMSSFTSKIIDIAVGGDNIIFVFALDQDHKVWAWGYNGFYQLGNSTSYMPDTPAIISGLPTDITAISAGAKQGIALSSGGNVYHWGFISTQNGESYETPTLVTGASPASAISAGNNYNLAKKSDGSVFAWGHLTDGIVPGITNPSVISAGAETYFNPMFITSSGTLMQTSFSMATGDPTQVEAVTSLAAYSFSLLSVSNRAFYVTQDGLILAQLSFGTAPIILNNPLE